MYVYGFGLLGIRIRDVLAHTTTKLWSGVWLRYLLLYMLLLVNMIPIESPYSVPFIALAFLAGIVLTMQLGQLRNRIIDTDITVKGGSLSLISAIMMGYFAFIFSTGAWQNVHQTLQ